MRKFLVFLLSFVFYTGKLFSQDLIIINSSNLKVQDSILVYKPISYNKNSVYPVIYLLHGHSGNYRSWSELLDLQSLSNKYDFIIVCPDGLKKSWYINSPLRGNSQYESFFIEELIPKIENEYHVKGNSNFVTGASMGGYGALWLLINYPDIFVSAGSISGVVNLRHSGFKKTTLAEHFGEYSDTNDLFDRYSIAQNLFKLEGRKKPFIFDCGTEDYLYKANKDLRDKCDELKLNVIYMESPGGHTGKYWSESLPRHFEFFFKLIYGAESNGK